MQRKSNIDPTWDYQLDDAGEIRERLQTLARQVIDFDEYRSCEGALIPSSYAQALVVLLELNEREHGPTLSDLVDYLGIDKSNVTRLCQRMRDAGHVQIERDPQDRRAKRIVLTTRGLELARYIDEQSLDRYGEILMQVAGADRSFLLTWLERLNNSFEKQKQP